MINRSEYMARRVPHDGYYGQFVTLPVLQLVREHIGIASILCSQDEHFNDIALAHWDAIEPALRQLVSLPPDETWSLSTSCCIAKSAARRIKESETNL